MRGTIQKKGKKLKGGDSLELRSIFRDHEREPGPQAAIGR